MLQELGPDKHWVSESIFGTLFVLFVVWTFSPFVLQRKRFYTAVLWSRLLMVLVGKQLGRTRGGGTHTHLHDCTHTYACNHARNHAPLLHTCA